MPAPPNTTALTAIDLGAFPASLTQDVHDAGTTYTVWYRFTAPADGVVAWGKHLIGDRSSRAIYHQSLDFLDEEAALEPTA